MTVYLVGAGPGDPGLLTVRGAELLRAADVVVYDRLASPALLDLAPAGAEMITRARRPAGSPSTQERSTQALVEHGAAGAECVVRLKGGDPFVFGRGGEEAEALVAAGIPFEVVPGITSAIGAPAYAGIPVTHRGVSTHFTDRDRSRGPGQGHAPTSTGPRWRAPAARSVILMGAGRIGDDRSSGSSSAAAPPDTPVAAVRNGTRPDQRTVRATLATIAEAGVGAAERDRRRARSPGWTCAWFETRPLFGRSVVVTRRASRPASCGARLEGLGAEVIELPVHRDRTDRRRACPTSTAFAWLVFTSANGVDALLRAGPRAAPGSTPGRLAGVRVAAIGPGTARALARHGASAPDLVPERFVAESLLEAFPPRAPRESASCWRRRRARTRRAPGRARGRWATRSSDSPSTGPSRRHRIPRSSSGSGRRGRRGDVHVVVDGRRTSATSSAMRSRSRSPLVVSIGPVTSATAGGARPAGRRRGHRPHHRRPRHRAPLGALAPWRRRRHRGSPVA